MKRNFLLPFLALALTVALTGCSNSASNASPAPSAPAVAPTESPAARSLPDSVARGIDRAADDIGDAVTGMDGMVQNGTVRNWGTGGSASAPSATQPDPNWYGTLVISQGLGAFPGPGFFVSGQRPGA